MDRSSSRVRSGELFQSGSPEIHVSVPSSDLILWFLYGRDPSALQDEINGPDNKKRRTKRQKREQQHYVPWSALPSDLLNTIIKRLSLPDVLSIDHVCREWRWSSLSARQSFLTSIAPLVVTKANPRKRALYFNDMVNEERYATKASSFVGTFLECSSSGFLIIKKYEAIWFVNPITGVNLEVVKPPVLYGHRTDAILTKTVPQDEYLACFLACTLRPSISIGSAIETGPSTHTQTSHGTSCL